VRKATDVTAIGSLGRPLALATWLRLSPIRKEDAPGLRRRPARPRGSPTWIALRCAPMRTHTACPTTAAASPTYPPPMLPKVANSQPPFGPRPMATYARPMSDNYGQSFTVLHFVHIFSDAPQRRSLSDSYDRFKRSYESTVSDVSNKRLIQTSVW